MFVPLRELSSFWLVFESLAILGGNLYRCQANCVVCDQPELEFLEEHGFLLDAIFCDE